MIAAIDDSVTIHGVLVANKSLSQAYSGTGCVPDWTVSANQPLIYPIVRMGADIVTNVNLTRWLYNTVEIQWNSNNKSTDGKFQKITTGNVPQLKIIKNLASEGNTDLDVITLEGTVEVSGVQLPFSCSVTIRLSEITSSGYNGYLQFTSQLPYIDGPSASVEITPTLYKGSEEQSTFLTKWYLEGSETSLDSKVSNNVLTLDADDVTDIAVVRCDFYESTDSSYTNKLCSAYIDVDDQHDKEYLWRLFGGTEADSYTIRKGGSVVFSCFVATIEDQTKNTSYNTFKIKLFNAEGNAMSTAIDGKTPDSDGYYDISVSGSNMGQMTFAYDVVANAGNNISGIIYAT